MTNRQPRIDPDSDDRIENSNVDALVNLAASDAFSGHPLDDTDLGVEPVAFETGMTNYADALTDEEVHRFVLQTGETFVLTRIEVQLKGGGTNANVSADVFDSTAATQMDSTTAGSVSTTGATSGTANTILVRVSNSSGAAQDITIIVRGWIV